MTSSVNRILNEKGETLFLLRKTHPFGWCLPGGKIDKGETAEQACIRETFEETGIKIDSCTFIGVETSYDGIDVNVFETILDYTPDIRRSPKEHMNQMWIKTHKSEYNGDYTNVVRQFKYAGNTLRFIDLGRKHYIPECIGFSSINRLMEEYKNNQVNKDI